MGVATRRPQRNGVDDAIELAGGELARLEIGDINIVQVAAIIAAVKYVKLDGLRQENAIANVKKRDQEEDVSKGHSWLRDDMLSKNS